MGRVTKYDVFLLSFAFASFASTMTSLCSRFWYVSDATKNIVTRSKHRGLWEICFHIRTNFSTIDCELILPTGKNIAARILILLTCLILIISVILTLIKICKHTLKMTIAIVIMLAVAALSMLIAMVTATFMPPETSSYGWGYILGWVSFAVILSTALVGKIFQPRDVSSNDINRNL